MLVLAQEYKEELRKKLMKTWENPQYWYYNNCSYFSILNQNEEDTWNNMRYVSVNSCGEIIGYMGYGIARESRHVSYLEIINFTDDISFGADVWHMVKDIFEKYRYRKINFSVIIGNPIESKYDRIISRYGGRIVGIYKENVMLPDGQLYDEKLYEILRTAYLEHRKCN